MRNTFQIRDGYDGVETTEIKDEIHIVASDGRIAFAIEYKKDGSLQIRVPDMCKVGDVLLDTQLHIVPHHSSSVTLVRRPYDN